VRSPLIRRWVAAIGLTLIALVATAPSAVAKGGSLPATQHKAPRKVTNATFGAAPANKKGPDGQQHFVFDTTPGGFTTSYVAVINFTHKVERLQVYTVDAVPATNGVISFPARSAKRTGAGAWMSVGTPHGQGYVDVKPRSTVVLPVHVRLPYNASPGDHVGAVVVSLIGKVKSQFGSNGSQNVNFEQRLAVQAQFRVSGPLYPNLSIVGLSASYHGPIDPFAKGDVRIHFAVHNGGNVVLGGPQTVTVRGLLGQTETVLPIAVPGLLPGATYPVTVTVPKVYPELFMSAKVSIDVQGLQGQVDTGLHPVEAKKDFLAVPWVILAGLLVLLLMIWRAVRRRRKRARDKKPAEHKDDNTSTSPPSGPQRGEPVEQGAP
jgi:hypothetical protein